jgi:hypothetical protein
MLQNKKYNSKKLTDLTNQNIKNINIMHNNNIGKIFCSNNPKQIGILKMNKLLKEKNSLFFRMKRKIEIHWQLKIFYKFMMRIIILNLIILMLNPSLLYIMKTKKKIYRSNNKIKKK